MSFAQRLSDTARLVERRLIELLGDFGGQVAADHEAGRRLTEAMVLAATGGGKRLRPFLVVETAGLFGVAPQRAADAAAALECVHCYSLVHDDLPCMDNDVLRRGQPTVWKAFDEWTAVLAGDALLTLAFEILSHRQTHDDAEVRNRLIATLARAAGMAGMVGGQALDLAADKLGQPARPTAAHIERLQQMKTGALIAAACDMGAILGNAAPAQRESLLRFGKALGLAFQIADDLLDAEGDPETVGKAVGKDAAAGKATLVSLLGADAARDRLAQSHDAALAALSPFGSEADVLREAAVFVVSRKA